MEKNQHNFKKNYTLIETDRKIVKSSYKELSRRMIVIALYAYHYVVFREHLGRTALVRVARPAPSVPGRDLPLERKVVELQESVTTLRGHETNCKIIIITLTILKYILR